MTVELKYWLSLATCLIELKGGQKIKKMKFNIRKISAIGASVLMAGMTMGLAAAANYPAPFVSGGTANVAIVYGTNALNSDFVKAGNIQTDLGEYVTGKQVTIEGEHKNLATSARNLYYADAINSAYSSISATELPTVLADGTFSDLSGTQYTYSQTIALGTTVSAFGTSGGDFDDPTFYLDVGTDSAVPLYNYTLSFNKNLNVSDSTNVQGEKISLLGVDYVIGASSTNTTLYLYGSGAAVVLGTGETQDVTVGGLSHSVELVAATGTTTAKITVDGISKTVTQGNSYSFTGDLNVYVKDVTYQAYASGIQSVELLVGANTLKLVDGATVKQGADLTSIKNTLATITAAGVGQISAIKVSVAAPKSQEDSLIVGESFADPVFGGFTITFEDVTPGLTSSERASIKVDTDNNAFARATFTSARAASAGEQQITYVYDNDTSASAVSPTLAHKTIPSSNNQGLIHVVEGESAQENDWVILNQGDSGTILLVDDMSIDTATAGTITLQDAITGVSQIISLTNDTNNYYSKTGVNMFGGTGYVVNVTLSGDAAQSVAITWNAAGTKALFPRIKLADGGWLAFMQNTTLQVNTTAVDAIFPNGLTTLGTDGTTLNNISTSFTANGITFSAEGAAAGTTKITGITSGTSSCSFGVGPAVLFIEPKKWDDGSYGNFICIPMTTAGTTEIAIGQAVLNGTNSGFTTLTSDTYEAKAIDQYGSLVTDEQRTNQNGVETISYPKSQMYLDIVATAEGAVSTTGSSGVLIVKDSEVSSVATKNLIVVGGSCINTAAAALVGGNLCGAAWETATGVGTGQFLIKSYASTEQSLTSKMALLVAGYEAADTVNAATYLTTKTVDTSVGGIGTTSTAALMAFS